MVVEAFLAAGLIDEEELMRQVWKWIVCHVAAARGWGWGATDRVCAQRVVRSRDGSLDVKLHATLINTKHIDGRHVDCRSIVVRRARARERGAMERWRCAARAGSSIRGDGPARARAAHFVHE